MTTTQHLARDWIDDPPRRIDGSIPVEHFCYECAVSSLTVPDMHSIIRYNKDRHEAEYRFACADIGPCSLRKAGVTP